MQIFIRTTEGRTRTLDVFETTTIGTIKAWYEAREGLPYQFQRIIYSGRQINDSEATLHDLGIVGDTTLHVYLRVVGQTPPILCIRK